MAISDYLSRFPLHPHLLLETLAYLCGFRLYRFLRNRYSDPVSSSNRWSVVAAAAVGAALGSKLLFFVEDPGFTWAHLHDPIALMGGKTIIGGLIGGLLAVELTKKICGIQVRTGDLFAVPLCLGIAIGRLGCFFTGLADNTYGIPTTLPWGVDFGDGIRRHPVQLYEVIFMLALGLALFRLFQRPHVPGDIFKCFMVAYACFRLLIDFLKPYPRFAGLGTLQWACIFMFGYYVPDLWRWVALRPEKAMVAGQAT